MDRERYQQLVTCQEAVNDLRHRIKALGWPHYSLLESRRLRIESDLESAARHDVYHPPCGDVVSLMGLVEELENADKQ